jgi:6-phosphogluconolactonase (cycloisomerase 2 family)
MKFSLFGRIALALLASSALGLGMTACGGGTIGYIWVLGQQYNQIGGFKVDDYTGNLTAIPNSPFSSNGSVPVSLALKPGGRYLYVLNQGTATGPICTKTGACTPDSASGIAQYAVGGDGTLTYQQTFHSQGFVPKWLQFDSSGQYLYELDTFNPLYQPDNTLPNYNPDNSGVITAFSVDATTGKLTLVTNPNVKVGGVNTTYYKVGTSPFMLKTIGGCLFTVNGGDQTLTPYTLAGGGTLTPYASVTFPIGSINVTSMNGSGSFMLLTDNMGNTTTPGRIYFFSVGSGCVPTAIAGSPYANLPNTSNPSWAIVDNSSKYVYVLNKSTTTTGTTTTPYSSISAFTISSNNSELQPITTSASSTYAVGSSPVCMIEDTSNKYIYVSSFLDSSITGKVIDQNTGALSDLSRGSTFKTVGNAGCLTLSGAVD